MGLLTEHARFSPFSHSHLGVVLQKTNRLRRAPSILCINTASICELHGSLTALIAERVKWQKTKVLFCSKLNCLVSCAIMHAENKQTATPTNTLTHLQIDFFFVDLSTAFCSYFISKADILIAKRLIGNDDYIGIYDILCV